MFRIVLILILLAFSALTVQALLDHGYIGIFEFHFTSTAGMQVIVDLVLACLIAAHWMHRDARKTGRNPWPYLVTTVFLGSFGPLLYLLIGEFSRGDERKAVLA